MKMSYTICVFSKGLFSVQETIEVEIGDEVKTLRLV